MITPAIAKRTSAIAISTIMSSVLLFPPLFEDPEFVLPGVVELELVAVAEGVAVAVALGVAVGEGIAVGGDVTAAVVMVRCFTPVV